MTSRKKFLGGFTPISIVQNFAWNKVCVSKIRKFRHFYHASSGNCPFSKPRLFFSWSLITNRVTGQTYHCSFGRLLQTLSHSHDVISVLTDRCRPLRPLVLSCTPPVYLLSRRCFTVSLVEAFLSGNSVRNFY